MWLLCLQTKRVKNLKQKLKVLNVIPFGYKSIGKWSLWFNKIPNKFPRILPWYYQRYYFAGIKIDLCIMLNQTWYDHAYKFPIVEENWIKTCLVPKRTEFFKHNDVPFNLTWNEILRVHLHIDSKVWYLMFRLLVAMNNYLYANNPIYRVIILCVHF